MVASSIARMAVPAPDPHRDAVEADYNARVEQWQGIYAGTTFHDHVIKERLRRALALVDDLSPAKALDVGCGAGQFLGELAVRGVEIAGVDLAEGMVAAAGTYLASLGVGADLRVATVEQLPFRGHAFDLVSALGVIEYLTDPEPALRELHRVLRPGGHLLVTAPNPVRLSFLCDPLRVARGVLRPPPRGYPRRYSTPWALRAELTGAGFEIVHFEGHGLGEWTFAGRPVLAQTSSIAVSDWLESHLPAAVANLFGANLIAVGRVPG